MQPRYYPLLIATCATVALALAMVWLSMGKSGADWSDLPLGKAGLTAEYCEHNRMEAFIRQPANAWSNLAYALLGLTIMAVGWRDWRATTPSNALQRFPGMTIWVGLTLFGLCGGSFFFHASLTRLGQHWDMTWTYAVALAMIGGAGYRWAVALGRPESAGWRATVLSGTVAAAVLLYFLKWQVDGKVLLPILMGAGVALAAGLRLRLGKRLDGRLLLAGMLALVLSGVARSLDLAKVGCDPHGWMQLHAAWHIFTGLSAFLFWAYLHSEKA